MVFSKIESISKMIFLSLILFSAQILAQEIGENEFFNLSLEELMQVDVSIATKTLVKTDDVPGMVSVVLSSDLVDRGYDNLWQSLAGLPGIQISIDSTGSKQLVVRGVGKTYSSGKVKMLLNGVPMNSTINANAEALMSLPIQQIERIELIRGPGSAVHGEFAYAGVINVITKKSGKSLYAVLEQTNTTKIGGHYQWQDKQQALNVNVSFATSVSDGEDLESGLDSGSLIAVPGYSSGAVNTKHKMSSLIFDVNYENLNVSLQWLNAKRGDHFGINDYLPPDERDIRISEEVLSLHSHIDFKLSPTLLFNASVNMVKIKIEKNRQFAGSALVYGALVTAPDVVSNVDFEDQKIETNFNLTSTTYDNHVLFAEISLTKSKVLKADLFLNFDPIIFLPSVNFFAFTAPINKDQDRAIVSLTLQDEFTINQNLILTTGVRYDRYDNNIGSGTTPRTALVFHATDQHSFRAQYAEAFRPPTFLEQGGALNNSIAPETIQTLEFGHHYKSPDVSFKSVLFKSNLKGLITFVKEPDGFLNRDKASLLGLEFEYSQIINSKWVVNSNLSLIETEDKNTGKAIFGTASVLANAHVDYKLNHNMTLKTHFNYVGKRDREVDDTRKIMGDYFISNASISVRNLSGITGLSLSAGINNVFNQDIRFQSEVDTYVEDYPYRDARSLWMKMNYAIQ